VNCTELTRLISWSSE